MRPILCRLGVAAALLMALTLYADAFSGCYSLIDFLSGGTAEEFVIRGMTVNEDGEPLSDATVEITVSIAEKDVLTGIESWQSVADKKLTTSSDGSWRLTLDEVLVPEGSKLIVNVSARSTFRYQRSANKSLEPHEKQRTIEFAPLKLFRGIRVAGKVIAPEGNGETPKNATVSLFANNRALGEQQYTDVFYELVCNKEGGFSAIVPSHCELSVDAAADNFASTHKAIDIKVDENPADAGSDEIETHDLGEIELKRGVSVFGVARKLDGTPAAGVVLAIIEGDFEPDFRDLSSVKTDRNGKFRFYPHSGLCKILSVPTCRNRKLVDGQREVLHSRPNYPLFEHELINLDDAKGEMRLDLTEVESVTISGTVFQEDGRPASGVAVYSGWRVKDQSLPHTFNLTNNEGKYSIRVPKDSVPTLELGNENCVLQDGYAISSRAAFENPLAGGPSSLRFKPATDDIDELNWINRPLRSQRDSMLRQISQAAKWWLLDE